MSTVSPAIENPPVQSLEQTAAIARLASRMGEGRAIALAGWAEKSRSETTARAQNEPKGSMEPDEGVSVEERRQARAQIKKSERWTPLLKMTGLVLLSFAGKGLHELGAKKIGMAIVEKTVDALALAEKEADMNNVDAVIAVGSRQKLNKTFCEICLTSPRDWEARAAKIAASPLFDPLEPAYPSWFQVNPFAPGAKRGESVTPLAALAMGASLEKRLIDPQKLKLLADVALSRAERVELGQWVSDDTHGAADGFQALQETQTPQASDIALGDARSKSARRL